MRPDNETLLVLFLLFTVQYHHHVWVYRSKNCQKKINLNRKKEMEKE